MLGERKKLQAFMEWVLNNDVYLFQDKTFKQCKVTCIGALLPGMHVYSCVFGRKISFTALKRILSLIRSNYLSNLLIKFIYIFQLVRLNYDHVMII